MKKTKRQMKKYLTGTKVKGYMENPGQELEQNSIDIAQAEYEAESNPWYMGLRLAGNLMMESGMSMASKGLKSGESTGSDFWDKAIGSDSLKNVMQVGQFLKKGGMVSGIPIEVEDGEAYEKPSGEVGEFDGAPHALGGIETVMPEGTMIYSEKLKVAGKSLADRKLARERKQTKIQKKLDDDPTSRVLKSTFEKIIMNNEIEEKSDVQVQEFATVMDGMMEFCSGGRVKKYDLGTPPWGIKGGWETQTQNKTDGDDSEEEEEKAKMPWTTGDIFGMLGTAYSTLAPRLNTKRQRGMDTPYENIYEDFGVDALAANTEAMSFVEGQQDKAIKDVSSSTRAAIKRGRNRVRGVNQMQASDIALTSAGNKAVSDIYDNFSKQMMSLYATKSGLELEQDKGVMAGETEADRLNRAQQDAYFSQLAQDIATTGTGVQKFGADLNKHKQNQSFLDVLPDTSKWGLGWVYEGGKWTLKELDKGKKE